MADWKKGLNINNSMRLFFQVSQLHSFFFVRFFHLLQFLLLPKSISVDPIHAENVVFMLARYGAVF